MPRPPPPRGRSRSASLPSRHEPRRAVELKLDPDVWFNNVKLVAERRVGHETVSYVRNSYKYYAAYKLQLEMLEARRAPGSAHVPGKKN